jgi:primosomal protein N' (replication factor Y)
MYAEVLVNLPVEGTFHYHIPAELAGRLQIGHLVEVTFGQQKAQGVVLGFDQRSPVKDTKPVERLVDHRPLVSERQLALARWMSEAYLAPLADCVRLFIPPGMSKRGDVLVTPVIDPDEIAAKGDTQARLLSLLKRRGALRGRQIARSLPRRNWRAALGDLVERGLALREPVLDPPSIGEKRVRVAELGVRPQDVETAIADVVAPEEMPSTRQAAAQRRADVLRLLASRREPLEVGDIYAAVEGSSLADLRALADDDLVTLREEETWRDPLAGRTFVAETPPRMTPHQRAAWEAIRTALNATEPPRPILLHGVTGSGKTELYLRAVEEVIANGRSAIVLVPEIALTPQTVRRFGARFPGRMALIHSGLSPGERYDAWRRAHEGHYDLVVGPRSALFAPLDNLGLIVIDECHDDSYKQSPPIVPPYYHALPAAVEMARVHGALVLMGSATPNVTTYARAVRPGNDAAPVGGEPYTLLELPARIMGHREAIAAQAVHFHIEQTRYTHHAGDPDEAVMIDMPPVQVVDMRQELRAGNRSIFSRALLAAIVDTLARREQAILFLNRRGTSTYVFCRACGHVMTCPRCDTPLTWHTFHRGEEGVLVCHHCDYRTEHPDVCPACGSDQIKFFGGGTERVEKEVRRQFPQARVVRWDRDTTGGKDTHDVLLQTFIDHEADVLVGTQMVAKGLDLPLVTLVGVISADTALYLPDYRSGERTFQLLTQVAGRAGRGLLGGRVVLQTYAPEHYAIRAAAEHNFDAFYAEELRNRKDIGYPPFSRLARLEVRAESSDKARTEGERLRRLLEGRITEAGLARTSLIGPAPCFYPRREGLYRWHILVRGPNPAAVLADLRSSHTLYVDVDPVSVL